MKNMDESFDARLVERLRDYSEEPRTELWRKIAATTDAGKRPLLNRKKIIMAWSVFVLGVIVVGGLYYFDNKNGASIRSKVVSNEISTPSANKVDEANSATSTNPNTVAHTTGHASEVRTINSPDAVDTHLSIDRKQPLAAEEVSFEQSDASHADEKIDADFIPDVTNDGYETTDPDTLENNVLTKSPVKVSDADDEKTVIKDKEGKHKRFSIYFTVMPTFGYQRIKANSNDEIFIESVKRISAFSTDRLGVRAELGVEDPLTKRIKVFGGLVYYQRKQTIDYSENQVDSTVVSETPNGGIRFDTISSTVDRSFEYELKNLGVQIGVSYELSRKKLLQTVGTGFELHFALNKLDPSQAAEFTNNPSAYVFYNLYYRIQYPAEGRLKAVFQPTLNYSFYINQNLNAPFYVKPYGLGLNLGLTYNF